MEKTREENVKATALFYENRVDCGRDQTCIANAQDAYHAAQKKIEKEQIHAGAQRDICLERARLHRGTPVMAPTPASGSLYPGVSEIPVTAPTNTVLQGYVEKSAPAPTVGAHHYPPATYVHVPPKYAPTVPGSALQGRVRSNSASTRTRTATKPAKNLSVLVGYQTYNGNPLWIRIPGELGVGAKYSESLSPGPRGGLYTKFFGYLDPTNPKTFHITELYRRNNPKPEPVNISVTLGEHWPPGKAPPK